ncbi:MAG: hypothetical protein PF569_09570 [Candidatus Woesearchaeota archaeon]|jgi:hypothetical protein|nr:hypothetical protein [Candidatus Woesearchaeota archaeon]
MLKKNKAQISIFIIIGVILIIVLSFLFFSGKYELFIPHDTKIKNQVSEIVEDCVYDATSRGVFLLGFQGGYIEIPLDVAANPSKHADFGSIIPNWDSERGDIPTILSMQRELENFVKEEAYSCVYNNLNNMTNFDISIDEKDTFEVESRINDHNVVVESYFNVKFNEKNSEEILTVSDYYVKLDNTRLGSLYKLAVEVYNHEGSTYVFEDLIIDQIRSADNYGDPESMPTEGMSFSCSNKIWTKEQLKKNLANLNNNNFRYLYFDGTYSKESLYQSSFNEDYGTLGLRDYFDKNYVVDMGNINSDFANYNVEVFMPSTEITNSEGYFQSYPYREFEVSPSSGQIVRSMEMEVDLGAKIPIPCIQVYHHLYDLDYDLIVKLTDYSEDGNYDIFQFPLRIIVENNEPKKVSFTSIVQEPRTFNLDAYCNDESYEYPLKVIALDNYGNYLDRVNVSYKCINLKCDMGETKIPSNVLGYPKPELVTDYPFCIGGKVIGEKEGYFTAEQRVNTDSSLLKREVFFGENFVELEMIPIISYDVDVETFLVKYADGQGDRIMDESEGSVIITVENKELKFDSTAMWPNGGDFLNKIEFLDDPEVVYNVSIVFMDAESQLRGLLELEDFSPELSSNRIQFVIPGSRTPIEENGYLEFYEYVQSVSTDFDYETRFY